VKRAGARSVSASLSLTAFLALALVVVVASAREERRFLEGYWRVPIPPQGDPPPTFSPLEASLDPASCGVCHPVQYEDWKTSLHSRTMGPGVYGQTVELIEKDAETALLCYTCHAPLTEQQEKVRVHGASSASGLGENPVFDRVLQSKGLVCVACHVRRHERFGPPKRDGTLESGLPREKLPHRGATRVRVFLKAEFCKGCHQFDESGFALNGKLLENTYNEWRESPSARAGIQCQDCHMPDRRHLWRGIHDPEMVKEGVKIHLRMTKPPYRIGETFAATLTVENTGVGHYFPTYVTPKVFIRAMLVDGGGGIIPESLQEAVIGREVPLDLSREIFDTRIPPKGTYTFRYTRGIDRKGLRFRIMVVVEPDHFYERFFEAILPQTGPGRELIEKALEQARRSPFTIFQREVPLT